MIDISTMRNEEIVRNLWRDLYRIICEHVRHCGDENTMKHVEAFMEGVSSASGLRYAVRDGKVYAYLGCLIWLDMELVEVEYEVINIYFEIKILRNSINRHYHKKGR